MRALTGSALSRVAPKARFEAVARNQAAGAPSPVPLPACGADCDYVRPEMAGKRKVDIPVVLADAETFGDAEAARRWKLSERSIRRYRVKAAKDPVLSGQSEEKRQELAGDWLPRAKQVRQECLERGRVLAASETDLHKVTGLLKVLNDAISSDETVTSVLGRNPKRSGDGSNGSPTGEAGGGAVIPIRRTGTDTAAE